MAALIRNHPRKLMAGGVIATALAFSDYLPNPMRTSGVQNIEHRYSSGGASGSHTPGAASPTGKVDQVVGRAEKDQGVGTPHYEKEIGDQKKQAGGGGGSTNNPASRKLAEASYGTKSGK